MVLINTFSTMTVSTPHTYIHLIPRGAACLNIRNVHALRGSCGRTACSAHAVKPGQPKDRAAKSVLCVQRVKHSKVQDVLDPFGHLCVRRGGGGGIACLLHRSLYVMRRPLKWSLVSVAGAVHRWSKGWGINASRLKGKGLNAIAEAQDSLLRRFRWTACAFARGNVWAAVPQRQ